MSLFNLAGSALSNATGGIIKDPFQKKYALTYKGTLYLLKTNVLDVTNAPASAIDNAFELIGQGVTLQLISSTAIEPSVGSGKTSDPAKIRPWVLGNGLFAGSQVRYSVDFGVDKDFGVPGAFTIKNQHPNEFFVLYLSLELPGGKVVEFPANSWVYNAFAYRTDRIFFGNELRLPKDTPPGLVDARKTDLQALRGDGTGTRKSSDRIYDWDVYNDLGTSSNKRPVLGGSTTYPYPRRCRTGRRISNGDEAGTFTPLEFYYIPSDEVFGSAKNSDFFGSGVKAVIQSVIPSVAAAIPFNQTFNSFSEIKPLYDQGFDISKVALVPLQSIGIQSPLELVNQVIGTSQNNSLLKFPVPQVIQATNNGWMSDEEFGRQMLSGTNPISIECLKEFPPASKLENASSALTEEHIASQLEGKTVQEALQQRKLLILNYYDIYMPYLERINSLTGTFAYASRTLLYLKSDGTLKPVAIELSTPTSQHVFTPPATRQTDWSWELAKAHVAANDAGIHQFVSHWLRTHACIEPFVIATQRQLSALHPLNSFLRPHFKNTMSINALARKALINAGGIIESNFTAGKYSIEMSAVWYKDWRFDQEALPADLIKRGMATSDAGSKHGLKLTVEDYPYAADGLEIWAAIEKWTQDYADIVYQNDQAVATDSELQAWWSEIINVGHGDKKKETWWVKLNSRKNLAQVLATIVWVASAHHAAVNFGQYAYAGYMPNHPTATHKAIPVKGSPEYNDMLKSPEKWFLTAVSTKAESITVMLTLEILSSHASDEEYLGQRAITNWTNNEKAKDAFRSFTQRLKDVEQLIKSRNELPELKNRSGPVNVPYTLLHPSSDQGLTGRGIPNSISI